jgi:uncharacterized protein (TIGR00730 family)
MEKIGIFCSASGSIDPIYFDAAHQIGEWMGKNGKTLIYGGANLGLMECVAKAVKENGGHVIGVVPSKLEENGKVSTYPDEIIATHDLSDRKDIILQQSDVLVALPGGIGTLDEGFHVSRFHRLSSEESDLLQCRWFLQPTARRAQRITGKRIHPSPSVLLL